MLYLNNAATSFPKPPSVLAAMRLALTDPPAEPRRGGGGEDGLESCRREIAELFDLAEPCQVVLLPSATHALNAVLQGLLLPGQEVITTMLEHNSMLRPLAHLEQQIGLEVVRLAPDQEGLVTASRMAARLSPRTALVAVTQASNVTGAIQDVVAMAEVAADAGVPLLIDAAQAGGGVPLSHRELPGRVYVSLAGHKGLYGPTGVGVLLVPDAELRQTVMGGTGVQSELVLHPQQLPLRHEAGTPNLPGIAGLTAGATFVRQRGVEELGNHRASLVARGRELLADLPGTTLLPLARDDGRAGILSVQLEAQNPHQLAYTLQEAFGIVTRGGLHCAPLAHRAHRTLPFGTLRASFGAFNDTEDVDRLVEALDMVSRQ